MITTVTVLPSPAPPPSGGGGSGDDTTMGIILAVVGTPLLVVILLCVKRRCAMLKVDMRVSTANARASRRSNAVAELAPYCDVQAPTRGSAASIQPQRQAELATSDNAGPSLSLPILPPGECHAFFSHDVCLLPLPLACPLSLGDLLPCSICSLCDVASDVACDVACDV